jgi:hypothetical protein
LGGGDGLVKTPAETNSIRDFKMADQKVHPTATEMDYPAHHRNYDGFIKLLKYGIIASAIVTALVIYIIAN